MRQFSAHTPPFKLTCKCISLANRYIHATSTYLHIFGPTYESGYQPFFSQIALSWVGLSFGVVLPLSLFFSCFVHTKGGFFSESAIRFSNLQTSKKIFWKNYPDYPILCLLAGFLNFNFRIVFRNIFYLEIWKTNCTFWKKATFTNRGK